ncbi:MAG: 3-hydroxyacyl-CoA dehydrogenase NAD-binding domain-containing protein [Solirubrobacteraceae bacterium]
MSDREESAGSAGGERAAARGAEGSAAVSPARAIGVLGAGTMGAGIAQLASKSGARTYIYDPLPEALEKGLAKARAGLAREAEKGQISAEEEAAASERLQSVSELAGLADCELVIEAAPERPEIKRELMEGLSEVLSGDAVIATNTSSLPVTGVAAAASNPERVVGMHFFNPAPVMRLVEVISGVRSSERALAVAQATGEAMGRTVIRAADVPGFLVNRCNRPFGLEGLRLLAERIADVETIDRICRIEGGFRMGPFELSDLVGVDTGFDVSRSFYELSFGEPRWRPSPLQARQVAAGLTGRKSGRGWYAYERGTPHRPDDPTDAPEPGEPGGVGGLIVIDGESQLASELREASAAAGYEVRRLDEPSGGELPALIVHCGLEGPAEKTSLRAPELILCAGGSLAKLGERTAAAGFHVVGPFKRARLVELTRTEATSPLAASRAERYFETLRKHVEWVGDAPGLVLGRIVCQLVNECAFALGEGVGAASDIDQGMVLGLNHPRGPLAWADEIGLDHVLAVLDALNEHYREERYRAAPELRRRVLEGRLGRQTDAGFFDRRQRSRVEA